MLSPEARSSRRRVFYRDSFAEGLSHGTDAISAAGADGSLADLFSLNNCPATNITPANAIANIAVANWGLRSFCARYQNTIHQNVSQGY